MQTRQPCEKIASLERQLKHEELRSAVLDKLIDIAEEQLNNSIRKKPGTNSTDFELRMEQKAKWCH